MPVTFKATALSPLEATRVSKLIQDLKVERVPPSAVHSNPRNAKRHPAKQIALLAENIRAFGFTAPILIDGVGEIIAGHARHAAALRLGLAQVPIIRLTHLTAAEKTALSLGDNKLAELGSWDPDRLKETLAELTAPSLDVPFDLDVIGFDTVEFDAILDTPASPAPDPAEVLPATSTPKAVSQPGDLWTCGPHVVACGDPLDESCYEKLITDGPAITAFVNPPIRNLKPEEVSAFLQTACARIAGHVASGGTVYWFVNWRDLRALEEAAKPVFGDPRELIVCVKSSALPVGLYSSQHELVVLYVAGEGPAIHRAQFARRRQHRSNVWQYPGGAHRRPVALLEDALRDCSRRGEAVLDPFAGLGETLIAAERTGRKARLIERDPSGCDLVLRRWQGFAQADARLSATSETFAEVAKRRILSKGGKP